METKPAHTLAARVIMLDDDEDSRESFAAFLSLRGLQIEEFEAAEDVLESIEAKGIPSVVVLDITLGRGMDGYEAARRLRALCGAEQTRLIAMTGHSPSVVREKSDLFDAILTKPVDADELVALIGRLRAAQA